MFRRIKFKQTFLIIIPLQLFILVSILISFKLPQLIPNQPLLDESLIHDNQTKSALRRVKTTYCRQQIIETYFQLSKQKLWPERLRNECRNETKLITCLQFQNEYLNWFSSNTKSNKIIRIDDHQPFNYNDCIDLCLQIDFSFSLFYHRKYCICTNDYQSLISHYPNSTLINPPCHQNSPEHFLVTSIGVQKIARHLPPLVLVQEHEYRRPKIVFFLLLSGRSILQIKRLLSNIFDLYHYYLIHVDSDDDYLYGELKLIQQKYSTNIQFTRERFPTIWGGSSLLTAVISGIQQSLSEWTDWDFILNLSDTSFPIKKLEQLERYLSKNLHKNFIKSHGKNTWDFIQTQALNKIFLQCERRMWRLMDRPLIKGIVWDGGSDWLILSHSFCNYFIDKLNNDDRTSLVRNLYEYFRYSLLPVESFFHVILRNTRYCSTIVANNLLATNWNRKRGCNCQQKSIVDWCGCSPNIFRLHSNSLKNNNGDLHRLISTESKPLFFARKFSSIVDKQIIDFVELRFLSKNRYSDQDFDDDFHYYFENNYHSTYDPTLSLYRRKFYEHFALKLLSINQTDENNDSQLRIMSTHLLFRDNKFNGIIVHAKHGPTNCEFKFLLQKFPNSTRIFDNQRMPRLKSIEICNQYQERDDYFQNFDCILNDRIDQIEIQHKWQTFFGEYHIEFILVNPLNQIVQNESIILNNTRIIDDESIEMLYRFRRRQPEKNNRLMYGPWKLLIMNQSTKEILGLGIFFIHSNVRNGSHYEHQANQNLAMLNREIIEDNRPYFPNQNKLSIDQLWYIKQSCLVSDKCHGSISMQNCSDYGQIDWRMVKIENFYSF